MSHIVPTDAEAIANAAASVPGVAGLAAGPDGVATFLPGRRVNGVRVRDDHTTIQVVSRFPEGPLSEVADAVRTAVRQRLPGADHIDVRIVDVECPASPLPASGHESRN